MSKRTHNGALVVNQYHTKRPITKAVQNINVSAAAGVQVSTILLTCAVPYTITGIRWDISLENTSGAANSQMQWALIFVSQGNTANAMGTGHLTIFYQPEKELLVWGHGIAHLAAQAQAIITWRGDTKTMRKFQIGDKLELLMVGVDGTWLGKGAVQYFRKT